MGMNSNDSPNWTPWIAATRAELAESHRVARLESALEDARERFEYVAAGSDVHSVTCARGAIADIDDVMDKESNHGR